MKDSPRPFGFHAFIALLWLALIAVLSVRLWWPVLYEFNAAAWFVNTGSALINLSGTVLANPSILWGLFLGASSYLGGRAVITRLLKDSATHALCFAFGAAVMALVLQSLGFMGLYRPAIVIIVVILAGLGGAADLFLNRGRAVLKPGLDQRGVLILAVFTGLTFIYCLQPTFFYDAVTYHLGLPRQYLMTGSTAPVDWHPYSFFPSLAEMLFGAGLATGGVLGAEAFMVFVWAACLLAITDVAREILDDDFNSWIILVPVMIVSFGQAAEVVMADPLVLLFSACGLYLLLKLIDVKEPGSSSARNLSICWGVMAGAAAGVKYTAWPTVLFLQGLLLIFAAWRNKIPVKVVALGFFAAFIVLSPWPIRNLIHSGNPVMPVPVPGLFEGLAPEVYEKVKSDAHGVSLDSAGLESMLAAPWRMSFSTWQDLRSFGVAGFAGPFAWIGLPFVLIFLRRNEKALVTALYAVLSLYASFGMFHMTRFAYPGLAAMTALSAAGVGLGFKRLDQRYVNLAMRALFGVTAFIVLTVFMAVSENLTSGSLFVRTGGDFEEFLRSEENINRREYSTIDLQLMINQTVFEGAYVLMAGETRFAYLERQVVAPSFISKNPLIGLLRENSPEEAAEKLKAEGFTHVLVSFPELSRIEKGYGQQGYDRAVLARLAGFLNGQGCTPLLQEDAKNSGAAFCELQY